MSDTLPPMTHTGTANLVAVMCPRCVLKPHATSWKCGGCGHSLTETFDMIMPKWDFCPWCGVRLVKPSTSSCPVEHADEVVKDGLLREAGYPPKEG